MDDRERDEKSCANWLKLAALLRCCVAYQHFVGHRASMVLNSCGIQCFSLKVSRHMQGQEPFEMAEAADHLTRLSHGTIERLPLLDVSRALVAPGPAVGPGIAGHAGAVGIRVHPVTCCLSRI